MSENGKDAYVQQAEAQLEEKRAEIEKLKAQAKKADANARIKLEQEISELEGHREATQKELEKIRKASGDAWKDLKAGLENSARELGDAVRAAASRFGKN